MMVTLLDGLRRQRDGYVLRHCAYAQDSCETENGIDANEIGVIRMVLKVDRKSTFGKSRGKGIVIM